MNREANVETTGTRGGGKSVKALPSLVVHHIHSCLSKYESIRSRENIFTIIMISPFGKTGECNE